MPDSSPQPRPAVAPRPTTGDVSITSSSPGATPELRPRGSNGRFVRVVNDEDPDTVDALDLPVDRYLDREISWLQFNERVLQLAADEQVPLLERARFLAIFTSNLDEFFMVRVAGLKRRIATGIAVRSPSGLEPREVLEQISRIAHDLTRMQTRIFDESVRPALVEEGISIVRWSEVEAEAPELAALARGYLEAHTHLTLATLRRQRWMLGPLLNPEAPWKPIDAVPLDELLLVQCARPLPAGHAMRLVWDAGLESATGVPRAVLVIGRT